MAKTKISEWSTTPASNTDIDGINIAEGCAPSGINDAIRDLMAQVRSWQSGASGDPFNGPMNGTIGATTAYSGAFTTLSASGTTTLSGLTASTALALDASKNVVSVANTGSGSNVLATSPTLVTPALGTPSSATLTNATGLPISTGVSGLGTGVATALAVNVGSAGAPVVNGGALGTPSSGTVTNLTGTASININGTVGATTPTTGAFTTLSASGSVTLSGGTANGVTYLNGSKVLTSGSALTFDGTNFNVIRAAATDQYMSLYADGTGPTFKFFGGAAGKVAGITADSASAQMLFTNEGNKPFVYQINGTEGMRLTSTGLGIGTSSPNYLATLYKATLPVLQLANSTSGVTSSDGLLVYLNGVNATISNQETGYLAFETSGLTRATLDSAGNLGLGVTPSAWGLSGSGYRAIEVGAVGNGIFAGSNDINFSSNAYYVGGWKYGATNFASQYNQTNGKHIWYTAPSGTAGNAISFTQAMTLDASGNLLVGATSTLTGSSRKALTLNSAAGQLSIVEFGVNGTLGGYIYSNASQLTLSANNSTPMTFETGSAERARIDSSGNFGIGYTSFTAALAVSGNVGIGISSADSKLRVVGAGTNPGALRIGYNGTSVNYIDADTNIFRTGAASETARIDSSGNFMAGTTSAFNSARVSINAAGSLNSIALSIGNANDTYYAANFRNSSGTSVGNISCTVSATSYVTSSDYRLKNSVAPMTGALAKVAQLKPVTYKWNVDGSDGEGFIAHELAEVCPQAVVGEKDAVDENGNPKYQGIDTSFLVATLTAAIQELKAEFDAYKASHP